MAIKYSRRTEQRVKKHI